MMNYDQKTFFKDGIFLSALIVIALVTGCGKKSSHWDWACGNNRKDLDLICEMSKSIPNSHEPEDLHAIDLCRTVDSKDAELNLEFYLTTIKQNNEYAAVGGYCDFYSSFNDILDYIEAGDTTFDGMLFQVHSCEPDRYEDLNLRAEALGLNVTSHQISNCEAE